MAQRQEAQRIQGLQIQGEYQKRQAELDRTGTLLGMAQQETAAAAEQAGAAEQAKMAAISGGIQNLAGGIAGFADAEAQGLGNTSIRGGTGEDGNNSNTGIAGFRYDPETDTYVRN